MRPQRSRLHRLRSRSVELLLRKPGHALFTQRLLHQYAHRRQLQVSPGLKGTRKLHVPEDCRFVVSRYFSVARNLVLRLERPASVRQ